MVYLWTLSLLNCNFLQTGSTGLKHKRLQLQSTERESAVRWCQHFQMLHERGCFEDSVNKNTSTTCTLQAAEENLNHHIQQMLACSQLVSSAAVNSEGCWMTSLESVPRLAECWVLAWQQHRPAPDIHTLNSQPWPGKNWAAITLAYWTLLNSLIGEPGRFYYCHRT